MGVLSFPPITPKQMKGSRWFLCKNPVPASDTHHLSDADVGKHRRPYRITPAPLTTMISRTVSVPGYLCI